MLLVKKVRTRGIAVMDILIGLGVLIVVLSVSAPSLNSSTAKANMRAAVENLEQSVQLARNAAKELETDVIVHLNNDPRAREHSIEFFIPKRQPNLNSVSLFRDYHFTEDIRIYTEVNELRFNHLGELDAPVKVHLASSLDDLDERLIIH